MFALLHVCLQIGSGFAVQKTVLYLHHSIPARTAGLNAADGSTVTCEIVENNDWLKAAGMDEIFYPSAVFAFNEAGLIQRITAALSPEDGAAMGAVMGEFMPWLMANRAAESAPLFGAEGQFIYSESNGRLVVSLLQEWNAGK